MRGGEEKKKRKKKEEEVGRGGERERNQLREGKPTKGKNRGVPAPLFCSAEFKKRNGSREEERENKKKMKGRRRESVKQKEEREGREKKAKIKIKIERGATPIYCLVSDQSRRRKKKESRKQKKKDRPYSVHFIARTFDLES